MLTKPWLCRQALARCGSSPSRRVPAGSPEAARRPVELDHRVQKIHQRVVEVVSTRFAGFCQRRGARVLAMTYSHPWIELAVEADERHLLLLRSRLENAIDVLEVNDGV